MAEIDLGGKWLSGKSFKGGEIIKILSEGTQKENTRFKYPDGTPKIDWVFQVEFNGQEKTMTINRTSLGKLSNAFSSEMAMWVGQKAKVTKALTPNGNEMVILEPEGA